MKLFISGLFLFCIASCNQNTTVQNQLYYIHIDKTNEQVLDTFRCSSDFAALDTTLTYFYSNVMAYEMVKQQTGSAEGLWKPVRWDVYNESGNSLKNIVAAPVIDSLETAARNLILGTGVKPYSTY